MHLTEPQLDYESLGLMVGLEIHQQLKTKQKLFCRCPNEMLGNKQPDYEIKRLFRPVLGEMGEVDPGMLLEFEKGMTVVYEGFKDNICTYEIDETPPFKCDQESLDIAWEIGSLLNMTLIDELHVCRKNYLDGSVPAGFQRTMVVAKDGEYPVSDTKNIRVDMICLEEDAARKLKTEDRNVYYLLDRLGIPLVEITTKPDINDPQEAREAAFRLGLLLRSTGKVHKVIGSIRQDINVSIKEGTRVEIKGVQKLDWIPILIEHEAERQQKLAAIGRDLEGRDETEEDINAQEPVDLSKSFKKTACKMVAGGLKRKESLIGLRVPKFEGLLGTEVQYDRRLGTEVSDRVKVITGLKGIIHSDEDLPKYGFSDAEIESVREQLGVEQGDAFIMVLGPAEATQRAMIQVKSRLVDAIHGVPPETRKALDNGNTEFMRKLQGGARLYPDTDSVAIMLDPARVADIQANLKGYPWDMKADLVEQYGISEVFAQNLILSGNLDVFLEIMKINPEFATLATTTLLETVTALSRDGKEVDNLDNHHFLDTFTLLNEGKMGKEAIEKVLAAACDAPEESISNLLEKTVGTAVSVDELDQVIDEVLGDNAQMIQEKGEQAFSALMGDVMKKVRGKIDGKTVSKRLKEKLGGG